MTARTVHLEQNVLIIIEEDLTQKTVNTLNVLHWTILKILKDNQFYPYQIQRGQAILPADFPPFCQ